MLLFAAETVLRVIFAEKLLPANAYDRTIYQFDPDVLVTLKPNAKSIFKRSTENGGDVIHWSTNRDGYRGTELRPDPGFRIIVYGDSNVQASFSRLENSFTQQLEKELQALSRMDVEVVNGRVVGMGPDQYLIRMRRDIDVLKPDIVIFHVFADNDFGDLIRNRLLEVDASGKLSMSAHETTVDEFLKSASKSFLSGLLTVRAAEKLWNAVRPRGGDGTGRLETGDAGQLLAARVTARQLSALISASPERERERIH